MMSKHLGKEFTCDRCGETFINSLTDEEIEAEVAVQEAAGCDVSDEVVEVLCDGCFHLDPMAQELAKATHEYLAARRRTH